MRGRVGSPVGDRLHLLDRHPLVDLVGVEAEVLDGASVGALDRHVMVDHPDQASYLVPQVLEYRPSAADDIGQEVADRVGSLDEDSSDEDMQRAAELLNWFAPFEEISASTTLSLGSDQMIQLLSLAGMQMGRYEHADDLALALRGTVWSGEKGMTDQQRRDYATDLVDYFRERVLDHDADLTMSGNDSLALSYLLRDGDFSTAFLDTMGDELDSFERSFPPGYSWQQMSMGALGAGALFDEDDQDSAFDPMASYMSALGNNGEASLQFFTEGDDRQRYWILERKWGHDDFESLLSALDSATTDPATLENPEAAALVSSTVEYLTNRDNNDWVEFGGRDEEFQPGDLNGAAARSLAHIVSTYMPAVDYWVENPLDEGSQAGQTATIYPGIGTIDDMPVFEKTELADLIGVTVSEDAGFLAMREGLSGYQNVNISTSISEHGTITHDASQADARLEAFFLDQVGEQEIAEGAEKDAQQQAWIDLGKEALSAVPLPGGSLVGFLAEQSFELGADDLSESLTNNEDIAISNANEGAVSAFNARRYGMTEALYETGVITQADLVRIVGGSENIDEAQIQEWFQDGFPSAEEIEANPSLEALMIEALDEEIDLDDYEDEYVLEFVEYFEK